MSRPGIEAALTPAVDPEQQLVQPRLPRQLRVERDREHVALPDRDRVAVDAAEHLDLLAVLGHPRGADEDGVHRAAGDAGDFEVGLERAQLATERVALARGCRAGRGGRGRA